MELGGEDRREAGSSDAPVDYDRVADVYDLYVTSDLDISFYVEEATKARRKVLELMCVTGRVSVPLLEAGVDLTCVDVSAGMLTRLEERLHVRKMNARVVRADIRHLDLDEEEFELAVIPFHSFCELVSPRDQELALRAVFGCLREGGRLLCPLHNPAIRVRSTDGALRLNGSFPPPTAVCSSSQTSRPWMKAPVSLIGYSSTSSSTLRTNCAPSVHCPCASP